MIMADVEIDGNFLSVTRISSFEDCEELRLRVRRPEGWFVIGEVF